MRLLFSFSNLVNLYRIMVVSILYYDNRIDKLYTIFYI